MNRTTARRAFMVGAPLAFAALLTQHPMPTGDLYAGISENLTAWLAVHYGGAVLFPLMGLVVWLLVRELPGRAAAIARCALPVYAVFYGVWEALFGIATGLMAETGDDLSGAGRAGVAQAVRDLASSPIVGEPGLFVSVGSLAWWTGISAALMALKQAGASRTALVLLACGGLMTFHVPIGPPALVCLSAAAYLIERRRTPARSARALAVGAA